ncbi:selenocysteine synthase [Mycobacterium bohemicum DSM 44277]|uniref:Selenocysteine synthase n=1 Tax=Mycobacterium bohemicum DSM 44277 TaxID=1236609 RepID=A0A0U0WA70_MYCBE|nr:SelB C-terminal domain-containing protein [Mycobacterium bohemicum]CPR11016.1 selenocysteine synthase [Mycobacterium bohemicum DSM 44277]
MSDPRRRVPSTDTLLADPRLAEAQRVLGRTLVKSVIAEAQQRARAGEIEPERVAEHAVAALPGTASSLRPVINATTRRVAVPLLEQLDARRVTRRAGDGTRTVVVSPS